MEFPTWEPLYQAICTDFNFIPQDDDKAAHLLRALIGNLASGSDILEKYIANQPVTICGDGYSLTGDFDRIDGTIITADEATSRVMHYRLPEIIVTDLDGAINDQVTANQLGSIVVIHAHADNTAALKRYASRFPGPFVLTTQARPFDHVFNFGGFTDGDRAYFMAKHFGARSINLLGFDFDAPRQKKGKDSELKHRKLQWAKWLIDNY